MNDHLFDLPLTRDMLRMVADPQALHRHALAYLPARTTQDTIRVETSTLFRLDMPSDPLGHPGVLRLRIRTTHSGLPHPIRVAPLVDGDVIALRVAAARRKTVDNHTHQHPVTDDAAHDWAVDLLARHGLHAHHLAISPARRYGTGARPTFPVRDILTRITLTDPDLANHAQTHGIGRSRSYGMGLIVTCNPTQ